MSKAFTKESDAPEPALAPPAPALPSGARNYLTPDGARRLRGELEALQAERLAGPLAPARRQEVERRLLQLTRSLQTAEVVEPPAETDRVVFGATVTLRDERGQERRYRIVGVDEADVAHGAISWLSPIAQALRDAQVGDEVQLHTPRGSGTWEVVAIAADAAP